MSRIIHTHETSALNHVTARGLPGQESRHASS